MSRIYISLFLLIGLLAAWAGAAVTVYRSQPHADAATVSFPVANCMDSKFSYATDAFPAIALPVTFRRDASCTPVLRFPLRIDQNASSSGWIKRTRVVLVVEWRHDAHRHGCTSQQRLVDRLDAVLVPSLKRMGLDTRQWMPILYGRLDSFYDSAGPYIIKLGSFDGVAIPPEAAAAVIGEATLNGYASIIITREPGPWNDLLKSPAYLATHWSIFSLNLVMLFVAAWRLRKQLAIQREMASTRGGPTWSSATRELLTSRDPQVFLHLTAFVYFIISLTGIQEHISTPAVQAISFLKWLLFIYALTAIKITWCRVAHSVTKRKQYQVLKYFSMSVAVLATLFALLFILGMVVPQLGIVFDWIVMVCLVGVPALLLMRAALFVGFSIMFLKLVAQQRVGRLPMQRLQVLTANGVLSSIAYFFILVSGCLFVLPTIESPIGYLIANVCVCIAGIIAQLGVFILPTANELVFHSNAVTDEEEQEGTEAEGPMTSVQDETFVPEWKSWNPRVSLDSQLTRPISPVI